MAWQHYEDLRRRLPVVVLRSNICGLPFQISRRHSFEVVSTSYTFLDDWIIAPSKAEYNLWIESIRTNGDGEYRLEYADDDTLEPIHLELHGGRLSIWREFVNAFEDTDQPVITRKRISLRLNDRSYSNYYVHLHVFLRNFLTLAMNRRNYPVDIVAHRKAGDGNGIRVYFSVSGFRNRDELGPAFFMLFNYRDLNSQQGAGDACEMLQSYLQSWIDSYEQIEKVHSILFTVFHQENIDTVVHFLLLTQALEAYHRGRLPGEYLAEEDYLPLLDSLEEAIDSIVPQYLTDTIDTFPLHESNSRLQMLKGLQETKQGEPLRQRLKKSIAHSYEYSLIKRLTDLRKHIACHTSRRIYFRILKMSPAVDSANFESKVNSTRNYYTHRLADRTNIIEEEKLPDYVERIPVYDPSNAAD